MMDPPGYNENNYEIPAKSKKRGSTGSHRVSVSKDTSNEPEASSSVHRRRKRFLEEKARKIIGGKNNSSSSSSHNIDGDSGRRVVSHQNPNDDTTRTGYTASSSSHHSSWVPVREVEKDPRNRPVRDAETENRISEETAKVRQESVPHKSWQPHRVPEQRHGDNLAGEMNFSSDNEWVPSEFYKKQQERKEQEQNQQEQQQRQKQQEDQHRQKELRQLRHHQLRLEAKQMRLQEVTMQPGQGPSISSLPTSSSHLPTPKHHNYQQPGHVKQEKQKAFSWNWQQPPSVIETIAKSSTSLPPPQRPPSVIRTIPKNPNPEVEGTGWESPRQPPSVIETVQKNPKIPKTPASNDDYLKRKSMASEMDWSDVVMSAPESSEEEEENNTILSSLKAISIKPSNKRFSDISMDPEDNSTIFDSFKAMRTSLSKRRPSDIQSMDPKGIDSDESSSILESFKALKMSKKRVSEESEFDDSLISATLTHHKDDHPIAASENVTVDKFVIPTIYIRKSGTSDITMDLDATKQMIESQLTQMSDEEITFGGSTIHNSILTEEEGVAMGPVEKYNALKERALLESAISELTKSNPPIQFHDSITIGTTSLLNGSSLVNPEPMNSSIMVSGTTTGNLSSLTNSNTSGTIGTGTIGTSGTSGTANTNGATIGGSKAAEAVVTEQLSSLVDEMSLGAARKQAQQRMDDIQSEVSSYVSTTLSQMSQNRNNDNEIDSRGSWHYRTSLKDTATMVSTKKVANKRGKGFKPRRSSTSTLPSIGSIIPEEMWDKFNYENDEEDDDDYSYDEESSYDSDDLLKSGHKLSSILEVASRDISRTTTTFERDISKGARSGSSSDVESGSSGFVKKAGSDGGTESKGRSRSGSRRGAPREGHCDCLDIRIFQDVEGADGETRRRFKPTCGAFVIVFLVVFMVSVWVGIVVVWRLLLKSD